jgi:riboflavin synthase
MHLPCLIENNPTQYSVRIHTMFTGIIQSVGHIKQVTPKGEDVGLLIDCGQLETHDVAIGDSIAVNGVCLTVVTLQDNHFEAHVSLETLSKTIGFTPDTALDKPVNLEKALRLNDRLGGHLVSGHVDGIGQVVAFDDIGECWKLDITAPHAISKFIAVKGSICVHGVSLTVNTVTKDTFSMNLIPHTLENTNLQHLKANDLVNLEVDQIARYVERMTEWQQTPSE